MKRIAILLIGVLLVLGACKKKDLDRPDIKQFPESNVWSVKMILDTLAAGTFQFDKEWHKDAIVKGYVIADESGGNIYRTVYLRGEDGKCIAIYRKGASDGGSESFNVKTGDHIGYKLYGSILGEYSKLPQIQVQEYDPNQLIVIYERGCTDYVQPIRTTIDSILEGKHRCDLVTLDNVQFESYEGLTYAEPETNTNRNLVDCMGNGIVVRTSGYASFAAEPLPALRGSLTSIASVYNTTWQLLIRNTSDVVMYHERCGGAGGETMDLPYGQSFSSSFGTYTTYNVTGAQAWVIDYQTAMMKGMAGGAYIENEDWLLSSPVRILNVEHAKAVVNYVAQYNGPENDLTVQISTDYVYGEDPSTATWTQLDASFPNSASFSDFINKEVSLDDFIGQTVTVALKYISTTQSCRTIEIKKIIIQEGEASGGGGSSLTGDGTRENPFTANDVIIMNNASSDGHKYWVKGYIVGVIEGDYAYNYSASTTMMSNVIISSDVNTHMQDSCVAIQLVNGTEVREGLNLKNNPQNYQQEVLLYGTLESYFQKAGVKNVTYAEINGQSYGAEPVNTEYFNEPLTTVASFNMFATYSVEGDAVWHQDTEHMNYGAVMTGYDGTSHANEDWLITPPIDLSGATAPKLEFEHARGPKNSIDVGVNEGYYTVWVSSNYIDGDPRNAEWIELTGVIHGTTAWGWVNSGLLAIPSECMTTSCRIAFKYLSIDSASATWEVKNVVVGE